MSKYNKNSMALLKVKKVKIVIKYSMALLKVKKVKNSNKI